MVSSLAAVRFTRSQMLLNWLALQSMSYRHQHSDLGIGSALLEAAEKTAASEGVNSLFVLTTQTQEWFVKRGFTPTDVESLPSDKQTLYNWQRGSAVLRKPLTHNRNPLWRTNATVVWLLTA